MTKYLRDDNRRYYAVNKNGSSANRAQRRASEARSRPESKRYQRTGQHVVQRQGDEIACSCGLRWPVGENHP